MSKKKWTDDQVLKLLTIIRTTDVRSFSEEIGQDAESHLELGDIIIDQGPGPQELLETSDLSRLLTQVSEKLPPRQQRVIQLRYGLTDGKFRTLDEVAAIYNCSRQRIEQVEKKALKKMKWLIQVKYRLKREDL